ncbi:hypothetical protein BLOT_009915 [Blomia tropicalis]|nr:hypothetical protein BLOT_009915 [Blomia tropicalis]
MPLSFYEEMNQEMNLNGPMECGDPLGTICSSSSSSSNSIGRQLSVMFECLIDWRIMVIASAALVANYYYILLCYGPEYGLGKNIACIKEKMFWSNV